MGTLAVSLLRRTFIRNWKKELRLYPDRLVVRSAFKETLRLSCDEIAAISPLTLDEARANFIKFSPRTLSLALNGLIRIELHHGKPYVVALVDREEFLLCWKKLRPGPEA